MAVKDLVGLYEASSSSQAGSTGSPRTATHHRPTTSLELTSPPPSPARFIRKSEYPRDFEEDVTTPRRSSFQRHPLLPSGSILSDATRVAGGTTDHEGPDSSNRGSFKDHGGTQMSIQSPSSLYKAHTYPPVDAETITSHSTTLNDFPTRRHVPNHTPVAATVVFARNAAPLYLPKLDKYLASLPAPSWLQDKENGKDNAIFPPMHLLEKSGSSLDDLEHNAQVPGWRNRKTILGSAVSLVLGLTGSSMLASFYSLQGLNNTVQMFALILSTIVPVKRQNVEEHWRALFLGTIPNVLALNFASTVVQSMVLLLIFMAIASALLYYFYRSSIHCDRYNRIEGLQQTDTKGKQWGLVVVTFLLTIIYLPLSTMAVHVLVWSEDMWIVPNPYVNATSFPPVVPPLGPATEFRDPLDFCWTTTMHRNEINFAPVIIALSMIVFLSLTLWFPVALHRVINESVPKVDHFTELGRPRNSVDLDNQYHRRLARDQNPFAFLYSGFRRGWGSYQSIYLFAKFSTLLIVAVIDPDTCLFRSVSRSLVPVVRQIVLLISTIGFFLAQSIYSPFLDPLNNASEWTSRLNYVLTATVALFVALNIPGKEIFSTYVLYIVYIITYGLGFYFTIINLSFVHRLVKKLTRRIDFSIDIFSPRLDLSASSPHTKRRIWQESISVLLLTNTDCRIPAKQRMAFAQARDSEFPPYLLDFCGSPGERHVENLKILREVGIMAYTKAVALISGPDFEWYKRLEEEIRKHFIGPDCYWKNPTNGEIPGCADFFGNAWWIPFPPTLVVRYDDGRYEVLQEVRHLEEYIAQNSSRDIQRRREVRMALRALEGQRVVWPYEDKTPIGSQSLWCCGAKRYNVKSAIPYQTCMLNIKRRGYLMWRKLPLGSGFDVELVYGKKLRLKGNIIGLNDDFDLTPSLAHFLALNQDLISARLGHIEGALSDYRQHHWRESHWKSQVLSYQFLSHVYDRPQDPSNSFEADEHDLRVRQLLAGSEDVFEAAYQRFSTVSATETAAWWYIFWDDLWRRNHETISGLELHASEFDPHYPTSIAYTPLPRPALEAFLVQRGLLSKIPRRGDFFHAGFLNKIYLRLNDTAFRGSTRAIFFHIGNGASELNMVDVDIENRLNPSTLGTGGGTDHDNSSMIPRPRYRWEALFDDPLRKDQRKRHGWAAKFGAWFGITPLWKSTTSQGISVDVRLENGRYVLIEQLNTVGRRG